MKVSVICGFYNRESLVKRTMESLINQNYSDYEIIIFDDRSTDNTFEELKKYEKNNIKIYQHKNNYGFVKGLINAIEISNGEYIAIQGSGDVSFVERLKLQASILDKKRSIGVVGCFYNNILEDINLKRVVKYVSDNISYSELTTKNYFSHGEVMFRRSYYNQVGGYRTAFKYSQDYDLWLRMIKVCSFYTVKKVLYDRYIQFNGITYNADKTIDQSRYSLYSREVNNGNRKYDEFISVNDLRKIYPENSKIIQEKIFKKTLRAILLKDTNQYYSLKIKIKSKFKKKAVQILFNLYNIEIVRHVADNYLFKNDNE